MNLKINSISIIALLLFNLASALGDTNWKIDIKSSCADAGIMNSGLTTVQFYHPSALEEKDYTDVRDADDYGIFQEYNHPDIHVAHKVFLGSLRWLIDSRYLSTTSAEKTVAAIRGIQKKIDQLPISFDRNFFKFNGKTKFNIDVNDSSYDWNLKFACWSAASFIDCQNTLKYLQRAAKLKTNDNGSEFIFSDLLEEVLTSERYRNILKALAKSLLEDVVTHVRTSTVPKDDIFQRIYNISKMTGASSPEARTIAINILGAYSIRGAAIFKLSSNLEKFQSGFSLLILSTAISYLDKIVYNKTNHPFSLPKAYLNTECLYGKPYHFWMAAYMSKLANNKGGFTNRKSFLATHLMGVAYELISADSGFNGRDSYLESILKAKSINEPAVRSTKIDIVFNSLGAGFGVQADSNKGPLAVDEILRASFNRGEIPLFSWNPYVTWFTIISPHSHLNMIRWP